MANNDRRFGPLEVVLICQAAKTGRKILLSLRIENNEILELTSDELETVWIDAQELLATFDKRG